jgi:hypothetical protein
MGIIRYYLEKLSNRSNFRKFTSGSTSLWEEKNSELEYLLNSLTKSLEVTANNSSFSQINDMISQIDSIVNKAAAVSIGSRLVVSDNYRVFENGYSVHTDNGNLNLKYFDSNTKMRYNVDKKLPLFARYGPELIVFPEKYLYRGWVGIMDEL